MLWRSSELSIRQSVRNALAIAEQESFSSLAFPLIGAGSGGRFAAAAERFMLDEFSCQSYGGDIFLVRYKPK